MKAKDFDQKFDAGKEDVIADLDLSTAVKPNLNEADRIFKDKDVETEVSK